MPYLIILDKLPTNLITWLHKIDNSQSNFITGRVQFLVQLVFFGILLLPLRRLPFGFLGFRLLRLNWVLEVVDNITERQVRDIHVYSKTK